MQQTSQTSPQALPPGLSQAERDKYQKQCETLKEVKEFEIKMATTARDRGQRLKEMSRDNTWRKVGEANGRKYTAGLEGFFEFAKETEGLGRSTIIRLMKLTRLSEAYVLRLAKMGLSLSKIELIAELDPADRPGLLALAKKYTVAELGAAVVEAKKRRRGDAKRTTGQIAKDMKRAAEAARNAKRGKKEPKKAPGSSKELKRLQALVVKTAEERDEARAERDQAKAERDQMAVERDRAVIERDLVIGERDLAVGEREAAVAARDRAEAELSRAQAGVNEGADTGTPIVDLDGALAATKRSVQEVKGSLEVVGSHAAAGIGST